MVELALLAVVVGALAAVQAVQADRALAGAQRAVTRARHRGRELALRADALQRLAQVQALAEGGVDFGAGTVQAIHQGIAAIPFGILEAIPATRDTTRVVRTVHDAIAGTVYGTIGAINRALGHGVRRGIGAPPPKKKPE